jgi:hypothetical protein
MNRHRYCWWCFYFGFGWCSRLTPGASMALAEYRATQAGKGAERAQNVQMGSPLAR